MSRFVSDRRGLSALLLFVGGVLVGALAWGLTPRAEAQGAVQLGTSCLPAVPFSRDQMVLVRDRQGLYFVLDATGIAAPVRFRDSDLRTAPSESLLAAP